MTAFFVPSHTMSRLGVGAAVPVGSRRGVARAIPIRTRLAEAPAGATVRQGPAADASPPRPAVGRLQAMVGWLIELLLDPALNEAGQARDAAGVWWPIAATARGLADELRDMASPSYLAALHRLSQFHQVMTGGATAWRADEPIPMLSECRPIGHAAGEC